MPENIIDRTMKYMNISIDEVSVCPIGWMRSGVLENMSEIRSGMPERNKEINKWSAWKK